MKPLLKKLEKIQQETLSLKESTEYESNDFFRLRKKIWQEIKELKQEIDLRNRLFEKENTNITTARMSSEIRAKIKKMNSMLSQLYKEQTDPNKQEIIDRYSGYLLELQKMEKSILTKEEHTIDISSNNEIKILPETLGDFYLLEKDDRIEKDVELISNRVANLKELAIDIGKKIDQETVLLDEITTKIDKNMDKIESLNKKIKLNLQKVRKVDRFIIDVILVTILLSIGGYIYNLVTNE